MANDCIDFGDIESIKGGSSARDEQQIAPHFIQARYGAVDIEDQLLIANLASPRRAAADNKDQRIVEEFLLKEDEKKPEKNVQGEAVMQQKLE